MRLFVFGLGYSGRVVAARVAGTVGTTRSGGADSLRFDDEPTVLPALAAATHVLITAPPDAAGDPVLLRYDAHLTGKQLIYLSSTGVYGDTAGAWVDETAPADRGRRDARNRADAAWLARGARVLRLPGIYGPGRSALERVATGEANRTGAAGQVFSRVHVDDLASGVIASADAPPGAYNLADDAPAPQDDVVSYAATLLGLPPPPFVPVSALSPAARAFHAENRRVANGKAKRVLGWVPRWRDYRAGLRAVSAMTNPMPVNTAPAPASSDQR